MEEGRRVKCNTTAMHLEVEMTGRRARIAGLPDLTDERSGSDALTSPQGRGLDQVGIEVAVGLGKALDSQIVPIEDRIEADFSYPSPAARRQTSSTGSENVEALMPPAAATSGAKDSNSPTLTRFASDRRQVGAKGEAPRPNRLVTTAQSDTNSIAASRRHLTRPGSAVPDLAQTSTTARPWQPQSAPESLYDPTRVSLNDLDSQLLGARPLHPQQQPLRSSRIENDLATGD